MVSLEKLKETQLPSKEAFYSRLSDEDYTHAMCGQNLIGKLWGIITNCITKLMFCF